MRGTSRGATILWTTRVEGRGRVKLPKVKLLNRQIDVIEAKSTATEARLATIEQLLERIAERLEQKPQG